MYQVKFVPVSMRQKGFRFYIEADMLFICRRVGEDASHMFVPVLSDGTHRLELPMVLVAGKKRYRAFRRTVSGIFGLSVFRGYRIRKILQAAGPSRITYPYRVCLDYEDWMPGAEVNILFFN
ncbi:hypothetical protein FACS1894179_03420 [Bacteroidia bacterium]|nr:hypothetical protein FACS1894179_03420 [Bacteroidia bacterium]